MTKNLSKTQVDALEERLEEYRNHTAHQYKAIAFWTPNDRMFKVLSVQLDNIQNYLNEIEKEIKTCMRQSQKYSK